MSWLKPSMRKTSFVLLPLSLLLSACSGTAPISKSIVIKGGKVESVANLYDYQLQNSASETIELAQLLSEIDKADVLMVGEWHAHPAVHLFQAKLMAALVAQERPLSLAMEHFTRADQAELNRYLAGEIGESTLLKNTKAWDNYKSDYRPMVEIARHNKLPVIAANAPRNHVKCVGRIGPAYLDGLATDERAMVAAKVDISESPYREKFLGNMKGMSLSEERIAKMFGAQMTWDATMAESIALHLDKNPNRRIFHVAGRFHTEGGLGTGAELLKLKPNLKIAYITAVTADEKLSGNDYRLVVEELPPMWVNKEERNAVMVGHKRSKLDCGESK
ncbi:ChaN family lipoprotein [uncultured Pseudoteredinibacter sp.]|uniref:ChaN family lipoprotein n=1 Tax=uncultured Pseudoteredinibacter sp. TaxID=1641701 RepID=UPI00261E1C50|nr:ChaN family lipoprotein [uncultured Pseudoteredinibacter sp.]